MEINRKDNLTDVVQVVPKVPATPAPAEKPQAPQQVVTGNGETVTLGRRRDR